MESSYPGSNHAAREDVLPASLFLQEKLQERRARSLRPKRARQSDFGPSTGRDDDIFLHVAEESKHATSRGFDSSPLAPMPRKHVEGSASNGRTRALGAKGMNEHMDRLTKQNFALKLELDHRRGHTAKLQEQIDNMREQVEWAERMKEEHTELLRINSQLVEELEKRDKAIEEAMDIICDLEDRNGELEEKVNDLEERSSNTRPSTANADSGYAGTETHEQPPQPSPPKPSKAPKTPHINRQASTAAAAAATDRMVNFATGQTPARTRREPHILSQKKASTHALRSVYLETAQSLHPVQSFNSLLTRHESKADDDEPVLNSPRLSVLSESSFPSIYSPKDQVSPDRYAWEEQEAEPMPTSAHWRQDSIKRVSQWMDERDQADETPSKSTNLSPPIRQQVEDVSSSPSKRPGDEARFQSLANAISVESPAMAPPSTKLPRGVSYVKPYPIRIDRSAASVHTPPTSFGGPMFGEPLLPPTPESASTRMLRGSRSSLTERSLLDVTPGLVKGYDALEPGTRTAPKQFRSSVELNAAYHSYLQRRDEDTSPQYDEAVADDNLDAGDETIRDLSLDYDGFPDGDSIIVGTPSRFLKHSKPMTSNSPYTGNRSALPQSGRSLLARRQSSSEATVSPRKPSLGRAETSPSMIPSFGSIYVTNPKSSVDSVTSPRSYHSGSSSNRTVVHGERPGTISPEELTRTESRLTRAVASPPLSRASPSPARTLSQKTQRLFRRMSNSHKDSNHSEREKSPLPTLTTAPSSTFVNDIPKEIRRPGTSYSGDVTGAIPRPPSSAEGSRPSLPRRTKTAPTSPKRPSSASKSEQVSAGGERRNPFKRAGSVQRDFEATPAAPPQPSVTRRRDSIRDAVGRRPWR